jgi:hypothetical protein
MPEYRVDINGRNILIEFDGRAGKHGFFTTRFVEAGSPAKAGDAAVQTVRENRRLRDVVRNTPDDPPVMEVVRVVELDSFDGVENPEPGFVWYPEDPKRR